MSTSTVIATVLFITFISLMMLEAYIDCVNTLIEWNEEEQEKREAVKKWEEAERQLAERLLSERRAKLWEDFS